MKMESSMAMVLKINACKLLKTNVEVKQIPPSYDKQ